jgi:hypothetical protein
VTAVPKIVPSGRLDALSCELGRSAETRIFTSESERIYASVATHEAAWNPLPAPTIRNISPRLSASIQECINCCSAVSRDRCAAGDIERDADGLRCTCVNARDHPLKRVNTGQTSSSR